MGRKLHFSLAFAIGMCDHIDTVIRPRIFDPIKTLKESYPCKRSPSRAKFSRSRPATTQATSFSKAVQEAKETGAFDQDVMQDQITQYANDYEFGARRGPGASKDPVMAEALKLAKKAISKALAAKYGPKHGKTAEEITEAARGVLAGAKGEKYLEQARQIVEITRAAADETLEETGLAA